MAPETKEERRQDQKELISRVKELADSNYAGVSAMQEMTLSTQKMITETADGMRALGDQITQLRIDFTETHSDFKALIRETNLNNDRVQKALDDHEARLRGAPQKDGCEIQNKRIEDLENLRPVLFKIVGAVAVITTILSLSVPPAVSWAIKKITDSPAYSETMKGQENDSPNKTK